MKYSLIASLVLIVFLASTTAEHIFANECGGVLDDGIGGAISYKVNQPYGEWENCLWTVRTGNKSDVSVRMLQEGFDTSHYAMVSLYKFGVNHESIEFVSRFFAGDRTEIKVPGPVFFVQFSSNDANHTGTGFNLLYEGVGADYPYIRPYNLNHFTAPLGNFHYPQIPVTPDRSQEVSTVVIMPTPNKAIQLKLLTPTIVRTGAGAASRFCYDALLGIYEVNEILPRQVLSLCRSERLQNYTIVSPAPILIRFFAFHSSGPNGENQYNIEWEPVDFECESTWFC